MKLLTQSLTNHATVVTGNPAITLANISDAGEWITRSGVWGSASRILSPPEYWLWVKLPTEMEFQAIEQLDNGQADILYFQLGQSEEQGITAVLVQSNYKIQMRDSWGDCTIPCVII